MDTHIMGSMLAMDIDLCRIHAWSSETGKVCYEAAEPPWDAMSKHEIILVEVASTIFYTKTYEKGSVTNRMKWAVYNSAIAGRIYEWSRDKPVSMLVSPSSAWTLGHPEGIRVMIAGVKGQDNHDLRECRCMLHYYSTNPGCWGPFPAYLEQLSKRKGK